MNPLQTQHKQDMGRVTRSKVGVRGGVLPRQWIAGVQQFQDYQGTRTGSNKSPLMSDAVDTGGVSWVAGVRLSADNSALVFSPAQVGLSVLAGKRLPLIGSEGWAVLWVTETRPMIYDSENDDWLYTLRDTATVSWRVLSAADYEEKAIRYPNDSLAASGIIGKDTNGVLASAGPGFPTKIQLGRAVAKYSRVNGRMTLDQTGSLVHETTTFSPYGEIFFL